MTESAVPLCREWTKVQGSVRDGAIGTGYAGMSRGAILLGRRTEN